MAIGMTMREGNLYIYVLVTMQAIKVACMDNLVGSWIRPSATCGWSNFRTDCLIPSPLIECHIESGQKELPIDTRYDYDRKNHPEVLSIIMTMTE